MMKPAEVHPLFGEVGQAYGPFFGPYEEKIAATGLEGPVWGMLAVAHDFLPDPVSAATFQVRNPYTNPQPTQDRLAALADQGMLELRGDGKYQFTSKGHALFDTLSAALNDTLAGLEPLPPADLERTAALMRKLIDAIAVLPSAERPCFTVNRSSDPGPEGAVMLRILQYVADFNSFRDDAHLRAWRPQGISGPAWEAFSFVWRDEAHTPAELVEQLPHRQLDTEAYTAALGELVNKGWAVEQDGAYQISDAGKTLRQHVEDLTEQYYFAPWNTLSSAELDELGERLGQLRDAMKAIQPAAEEA